VSATNRDTDGCACGFALDSHLTHAYNEEAFRYLLGVERKRAERSDRSFLLVLVELTDGRGRGVAIDPPLARPLFAGLGRALREADHIGWYRAQRIAGVVVSAPGAVSQELVSSLVAERIARTLRECLPSHVTRHLQVRVCRIQPTLHRPSEHDHEPAQVRTTPA
jgi:hypothetical protein